jgi:hypothetical protein
MLAAICWSRAAAQSAAAQTPQAPATGRGQGGRGFREPDPIDFEDHDGFVKIFDGATLNGWDGNRDVWRVEDGSIVGESTREKPAGNTFIVYHGVEVKDFDLKLEIKNEFGGGSGVQYRSSLGLPQNGNATVNGGGRNGVVAPPRNPKWTMIGPQMDYWLPMNGNSSRYTGQLYSQNNNRGILAWRGQVVQLVPGKMPRLVGVINDRDALGGYNKFQDWNQLTMIVRGGTFIHILNGRLMAAMVDDDPASSNNVSGLIGLQIEGAPCKVSFRNIWLKKIS